MWVDVWLAEGKNRHLPNKGQGGGMYNTGSTRLMRLQAHKLFHDIFNRYEIFIGMEQQGDNIDHE